MTRALTLLCAFALLAGCSSDPRPTRDGGVDGATMDATGPNRCDSMVDSDGDGLWDDFETMNDFDLDGTPNHLDLDSDGDGISDRDESGDLGGCIARNSDGDAFFDYLDNDSDNDGLSDREETETYFTDPLNEDSDGDGFTDTAEVATGHDPNDATDGLAADDFFLVLPFGDPSQTRNLRFGTTLRKADVFFMMDRTGSMSGEVSNLKSGLAGLVDRLVVDIPDIGVGVGGFAGFGGLACMPIFGGLEACVDGPSGDLPFELEGVITTDRAQMQSQVDSLEADQGGATWASSAEALYQAATGAGIGTWVPPQTCPTIPDEVGSRFGYPCFRPGALPIIVPITDTSSHNGPLTSSNYSPSDFPAGAAAHTLDETRAALLGIGARVFGIVSGVEVDSPTPEAQMRDWATNTGTVDAAGNPIVFTIGSDGSGLTDSIADAINRLATETPQDITTRVQDGRDVPMQDPPIDAGGFIKRITPTQAFDEAGIMLPADAPARDDIAFYSVTPGTTVEFEIEFQNDFVEPMLTSQVFLAKIIVVGNGVADLDEREVVIVVPAGDGPLI